MATGYVAGVDDLLIGGLPISDKVNVQLYIDAAAEELAACLSPCYETPLPVAPTDEGDLAALRYMHQHLATGRLIMAIAGANGGNNEYNQWADYMIRMAREKIATFCGPTATTSFVGVNKRSTAPTTGAASVNGSLMPGVVHTDAESGVEAFNSLVAGRRCTPWRPGL